MAEPSCVGFAGFTLLIWDHIDTFTAEVEYIWQGKKGILVYLFFLNRYLTPLGFIVNLWAYLWPTWSPEATHFIRYEGSMTVIGIYTVGLMMLIRINALYTDKQYIVISLGLLWLLMFTVQAWLLTNGEAVVHNPESGVRACTMIFKPQLSAIASSSAWMPLLYDSCVLILTLLKTVPTGRRFPNRNRRDGSNIMKRLFQDGLIYYAAIFAVNAVLTIMIISAPPGLKNIAAQVTVAMMSRITLNLKKLGSKRKLMGTSVADSGLSVVFGSVGPSGGRRHPHTITKTIDATPMHVDPNW
ncbi:hypothetical protein C8F04DRAFT_1150504 [Mycena alexandri]|uniref:DUF6533 domain-containing protein n=1 Tax=Mycena alexandri TaxID=1745969 RepID=A0AAD6RZZ1_9AGAR|nr:hypothetical protein C8F04DRAFT_1150504 [Mycena alexandri]